MPAPGLADTWQGLERCGAHRDARRLERHRQEAAAHLHSAVDHALECMEAPALAETLRLIDSVRRGSGS